MTRLETLTAQDKALIKRIVDNYIYSLEDMKSNSLSYSNAPGSCLYSLFINFDNNGNYCSISLSNREGKLNARFTLPKTSDPNKYFQSLNLRKAEFITQIALLEYLYNEKLIFFDSDNDCSMQEWEAIKHVDELSDLALQSYDEIIKSQKIFVFVNKYFWAKVIPSSFLIKFVRKDFRTPEQIRQEETKCQSWIAIIVAIAIGIVSPFLTTKCASYSKYSDNSGNTHIITSDSTKFECENRAEVINNIPIYGKVINEKP